MEIEKVINGIKLWIKLYEAGFITAIQLAEALEVGVKHIRTIKSN